MYGEYDTLEKAQTAVAEAIEDAKADYPGVDESAFAADMVRAIAEQCTPDVKNELLRVELLEGPLAGEW